MTLFKPSLLLTAGILTGSVSLAPAATPGSTPHTYSQCQALELSDQACHQQIIEAGGTAEPIPSSTRTVTPKNFRGWSEHERWYRKYVEYSKLRHRRIEPMEDVIHHYPGFPMSIPYHHTYP